MTSPLRKGLLGAVFAAPVALAEEAIFRGALTPARAERPSERLQMVGALAAFVGWHVLQGAIWPATRRVFWRTDFLAATAVLGAACTLLRLRSGSILPGVALHWGVIVAWRALGGPDFARLHRSPPTP